MLIITGREIRIVNRARLRAKIIQTDVPSYCHKMLDVGIGGDSRDAAFKTVQKTMVKPRTNAERRLAYFLLMLVGKCGVLRSHCFSFRSSPPAYNMSEISLQ